MSPGVVAFVVGVVGLESSARLPDATWCQLFPVAAVLGLMPGVARLVAALIAGFLWAAFRGHVMMGGLLEGDLAGLPLVVEGVVIDLPTTDGRRTRFAFRVVACRPAEPRSPVRCRFRGNARLSGYFGASAPRAGERWRLPVRLHRPRGFANPGGFDFAGFATLRGARAVGSVRRARGVSRRLEPAAATGLLALRAGALARIREALPGHPSRAAIEALALGVRGDLSKSQWTLLRDTGTAHLMAISGLHVGLVSAAVMGVSIWGWRRSARLTARIPARIAGAAVGAVAAVGYAAMAGFSISTQRAALMTVVALAAIAGRRHCSLWTALGLALLAVLLLQPAAVRSPGLALSFVAVAGIFTLGEQLRVAGSPARRIGGWLRLQGAVTLVTLPLLAHHFAQVPLVSPVANLVAVPWVSVVSVPLTLAGTALCAVSTELAAWPLRAAADSLEVLWWVLDGLARALPAHRVAGVPPTWLMVLALAGCAVVLAPRGFPGRWTGALPVGACVLWVAPGPIPGGFELTALDVGSELAVVVRTSRGAVVFAAPSRPGQRPRQVERAMQGYLRVHGLDGEAVLRVVSGGPPPKRGPPWVRCTPAAAWRWGAVRFELLRPGSGQTVEVGACALRVVAPAGRALVVAGLDGHLASPDGALSRAVAEHDLVVVHRTVGRNRRSGVSLGALDHRRVAVSGRISVDGPDSVRLHASTARDGALHYRFEPGAGVVGPRRERRVRARYWQVTDAAGPLR